MSTQPLKDKLSGAKTALVVDNAFISTLLCRQHVTWNDKLDPPTMVTDGKTITICPDHIETLTPQNVRWALANITLRLVFGCFLPSHIGARDPVRWDIACDIVINELLSGEKRDKDRPQSSTNTTVGEPWPGIVRDPALYLKGGKTIEGVYALLDDERMINYRPRRQGVVPFQGSPAEQSEAEADLHVQIAQARDIAKQAGTLSQNMARFVDAELTPKVHWPSRLRDFCTRLLRNELTWSRPSRRGLAQGLIRQGKDGRGMGDIVIGRDLSGSVTKLEGQEFDAEMRAIKTDCNPTNVHVIYFTSEVTKYECFSQDDDLIMNPVGAGGTRFSPVFRYIQEHDIDPACCVMLTDLECSDFGPIPGYPVLWVSTGAKGPVPFGEVLMLREQAI